MSQFFRAMGWGVAGIGLFAIFPSLLMNATGVWAVAILCSLVCYPFIVGFILLKDEAHELDHRFDVIICKTLILGFFGIYASSWGMGHELGTSVLKVTALIPIIAMVHITTVIVMRAVARRRRALNRG